MEKKPKGPSESDYNDVVCVSILFVFNHRRTGHGSFGGARPNVPEF